MKLPALPPSSTSLSAFNMMLLFMFLMNYCSHVTDFSGTGIWCLNTRGVWRAQTLLHTQVHNLLLWNRCYDYKSKVFLYWKKALWSSVGADRFQKLLQRLTSSFSPTRNSGFMTHANLDMFYPYLCIQDLRCWWGRDIWGKDEKACASASHRRNTLLL